MTMGKEKATSLATDGSYTKDEIEAPTSDNSLAQAADRCMVFAQQLHGIYVVVAETKSPGQGKRFRRRFYASLDSAQRHVDRARMDGREANLYMGRISVLSGDFHEHY